MQGGGCVRSPASRKCWCTSTALCSWAGGARLQELVVQVDDVVDVLLLAGAPCFLAGLVCSAQRSQQAELMHMQRRRCRLPCTSCWPHDSWPAV